MNQGARDENEAMWRRRVVAALEKIEENTRGQKLDVERLGLSEQQTTILREHLASRQQTVSEFLGDLLMDAGLGRATGKDYPPPTRLAEQDR